MTNGTRLTCEQIRDLAPAFVLGALERDQEAAVRAHLASCREAHDEISELGSVVPYLAETLVPVEPPARLKAAILAAAAADLRQTPRTMADPVLAPPLRLDRPADERLQRRQPPPRILLLVLALGAIVGGWWFFFATNDALPAIIYGVLWTVAVLVVARVLAAVGFGYNPLTARKVDPAAPKPAKAAKPGDALAALTDLRDRKLITADEYEAQRAKILERL